MTRAERIAGALEMLIRTGIDRQPVSKLLAMLASAVVHCEDQNAISTRLAGENEVLMAALLDIKRMVEEEEPS